jgi:AraC family transcriptional regulator, arabinose operon regulatory protein
MKVLKNRFGASLVAGISHYAPHAHVPTYRPSGLNAWVLNLTIEGMGRINQGPDIFFAEAGDLLLFPPQLPHDYSWEPKKKQWVHLWMYFNPMPHWAPLLKWPQKGGGVMGFKLQDVDTLKKVRSAMEKCLEMYQSPLKNRLQFCSNYLEETLLWCDSQNPFSQGSGSDQRIGDVVSFMMKNFATPLNASILARQCHLSLSRFAHLFQESTGMSPLRYLESLRIWKAQELLISTSKSIKEISLEIGFPDPLYFSKVFSRNVQTSPRRFRQDSRREA